MNCYDDSFDKEFPPCMVTSVFSFAKCTVVKTRNTYRCGESFCVTYICREYDDPWLQKWHNSSYYLETIHLKHGTFKFCIRFFWQISLHFRKNRYRKKQPFVNNYFYIVKWTFKVMREIRKKQHDFKSVHFECRMVLFYTIWEKVRKSTFFHRV